MEARVISRVSRRIVPFVALCYFVCYLDRVNVGFAALQMNSDLGFTTTVFGWGAGIFFFGYFIFEVPSNLALERFGRWKRVIGHALRSQTDKRQATEVAIAVDIL